MSFTMCSEAGGELTGGLGGGSEHLIEAVHILFAGADVWVGFVNGGLDLSFHTELSGTVVDGGQEHPHVDQAIAGSASDTVQTLLHVNAEGLRSSD